MTVPGTEGLHPYAQILGVVVFVTVTAALAAWTQHRAHREAERAREAERKQTSAAVTTVAAVAASAPIAQNYNNDAPIQTLAGIGETLERINERLDTDERQRGAEKEAELAYLRRAVMQLTPPR